MHFLVETHAQSNESHGPLDQVHEQWQVDPPVLVIDLPTLLQNQDLGILFGASACHQTNILFDLDDSSDSELYKWLSETCLNIPIYIYVF